MKFFNIKSIQSSATALSCGAIFLICTSLPILAHAQSSAKEGFEKLKANVENSKTNLVEYKKNLKVVDGNLSEIGKSKS